MPLRRAVPWLASLAAHLLLVLLVPLGTDLRGVRTPVVERRVVLEFDAGDLPPEKSSVPPAPAPAVAATELPPPVSTRMPAPPELDPVVDVLRVAPAGRETPAVATPTAREILDALPPSSAATSPSVVDAASEAAATEPMMRVEWSGKPRPWVRKPELKYPAILGSTGLEADGVARVTVSPLGAVVDVEITRSSGYTDIDVDVQRALRQSFVARIEGKQNQTFMVYFSFPQRRPD